MVSVAMKDNTIPIIAFLTLPYTLKGPQMIGLLNVILFPQWIPTWMAIGGTFA